MEDTHPGSEGAQTPSNDPVTTRSSQDQLSQSSSNTDIPAAADPPNQREYATYYCLGILNVPATVDPAVHEVGHWGRNVDPGNCMMAAVNNGTGPNNNQIVTIIPALQNQEAHEASSRYLRRRFIFPAGFAIVPIMVCIYALGAGYGGFYAYLLGFATWAVQLLVTFTVYNALLRKYRSENWNDVSEFLSSRPARTPPHPYMQYPNVPPPRYSSCESTCTFPPYTEHDILAGFDAEKGPATVLETTARQSD